MCYLRRIAKIQFFAGISDLTAIALFSRVKVYRFLLEAYKVQLISVKEYYIKIFLSKGILLTQRLNRAEFSPLVTAPSLLNTRTVRRCILISPVDS